MGAQVADVMAALDAIAPSQLAEPWDNVGLLLGEADAPCERALVALEVDLRLVRRAARLGAGLVVAHHPPVLQPLCRMTSQTPAGRLLLEAARSQVALAAAHTNYDLAPGGVNDVLAGLLDLRDTQPLAPAACTRQAKIVVFTPADDLPAVLAALARSGAGVIGNYVDCTFRVAGTGAFRPAEGAHPTVGRVGERQEVDELRVEAVLPMALAGPVAQAVRQAHSYEEPAVDVYPLEGEGGELGLGRCGALSRPMRAENLAERIQDRLGAPHIRVAGDLRRRVQRVAVMGGSGGKYVDHAARQGCELYLTGDVDHHQALDAVAAGLVVVDAGHAVTEAPAIPALATRLGELCPEATFTAVSTGAAGPFLVR
ncbi:MAG: Nif3-like dinuclear metal center hexameric protein [Candidatus Brocadiia bacterium]